MRSGFSYLVAGSVVAFVSRRAEAALVEPGLISVPAGSFVMGDAEGDANEAPKPAAVGAFKLMRLEVTNRQFTAFVAATDHRTDPENTGPDMSGTKGGDGFRGPIGVTPTAPPVQSTGKWVIRWFRYRPATRPRSAPEKVSACRAKPNGNSPPEASMAGAIPGAKRAPARSDNRGPISEP